MGYIFISYSHKDKEYVHELQVALHNEGFDVWIDHRIDYGTRWPKVIQEKLDSCNAFIVVASENSYESEWVQNEVIRAKRKEKPFFPLLLSGDPWLSVETTQYVDVRGNKVPPKEFFQNLREFVEVQNSTPSCDVDILTWEWPVYKNSRYNFSFKYPHNSELVKDGENHAVFRFSIIPNTNIRRKVLTVNCVEDEQFTGSFYKVLEVNEAALIGKRVVTINGTTYLREIFQDVGMGKSSELVSYSTRNHGINLAFSLEMIISSQGSRSYLLPKLDIETEREIILYILETFSWQN